MSHKILNYISVIAQQNVDTFYGPPCKSGLAGQTTDTHAKHLA